MNEAWYVAAILVLVVLFILWNNVPQVLEAVGCFLIAHARAIKDRRKKYAAMMQKAGEVL